MDQVARDDDDRGPLREPAEQLAAGTRWLLVIELLVVAAVAVLPVWSLAALVFRFDAARWAQLELMTWAFVLLCPFALVVLALVIATRLRGRTGPWAAWERVVIVVAQVGGYGYAALLAVSLLLSVPPMALLPAAPILIGLHQVEFIRELWPRGE